MLFQAPFYDMDGDIMEILQKILNEIDDLIDANEFYELIVAVDNRLKQGQLPSSASAEYLDHQC